MSVITWVGTGRPAGAGDPDRAGLTRRRARCPQLGKRGGVAASDGAQEHDQAALIATLQLDQPAGAVAARPTHDRQRRHAKAAFVERHPDAAVGLEFAGQAPPPFVDGAGLGGGDARGLRGHS